MLGEAALQKVISMLPKGATLLDIGSGRGEQAERFQQAGLKVTTLDLNEEAHVTGDYMLTFFDEPFDCIWACHILEHSPNVQWFLTKCRQDLKEGGLFAVTVPPLKHQIVGGHLTLWNAGLLLYNLVLAGWDCSEASVHSEGYDISVLLTKGPPVDLSDLTMDFGDVRKLKDYLPFNEGQDGRLEEINWDAS